MSTTTTREELMTVLARDENGKPTIWCDPEIADLVGAINAGGIETVSSCSGHGHRPGYIALTDGRWLIVANDEERKIIDAAFPVDVNGVSKQGKENRASDERLTLIAHGIAVRLEAGASGAPDLDRDIASAITELLSLRSKPVAGVEVKPLIDWLRKRGEPDSGIRYEGATSSEFARRPARVELHGADADFVAKHFHGAGARALADILSTLSYSEQEPVAYGVFLTDGRFLDIASDSRDDAVEMAEIHYTPAQYFIRPLYASPQPEAVITEEMGHPDDLAVDHFAAEMKAKLAKKRTEGRCGWDRKDECTADFLSQLLREHVEKGDPVDVGNLAMMLQQRGERITK